MEKLIKNMKSFKSEIKINDAAFKFLDSNIDELKASLEIPLL